MKKLLTLTIASVLFATAAFAQQSTSPAKGLYIGGGFVNNWYSVEGTANSIDNAWYHGPYVEVGYDLGCSQHSAFTFALRYDFLHSYRGAGIITPWGLPLYGETDTYRHYFDIPIRYMFQCNVGMTSRFFFDVGPTLNFMLANTTYTRGGSPYFVTGNKIVWSETEFASAYNPFNVSLGLNLGFYVGEAKLFVGYDYGGLISFTNVNTYGKGQIHQLRVGAAYAF